MGVGVLGSRGRYLILAPCTRGDESSIHRQASFLASLDGDTVLDCAAGEWSEILQAGRPFIINPDHTSAPYTRTVSAIIHYQGDFLSCGQVAGSLIDRCCYLSLFFTPFLFLFAAPPLFPLRARGLSRVLFHTAMTSSYLPSCVYAL